MALAVYGSTDSTSTSFSHDSGSSDRRLLTVLVELYHTSDITVSGVTYGGTALTKKVGASHTYAGTRVVRAETWYLENPATGSNTVAVTLSGSPTSYSAVAVTWTDADTLGANTNTTGGNLSDFSLTITTSASTSKLLHFIGMQAARAMTDGTGVTFIDGYESGAGVYESYATRKDATGGSDTLQVTVASAVRSAACIVEVTEDLGSAGYTLTAAQGSFTQTGQAAGLYASRLLTSAHGAFTQTGQPVNLLAGRLLTAGQGAVALSGQDANFVASRLLTAGQGGITLSGQDANLLYGRTMTAEYGTFTLTGQAAALLVGRLLTGAYGAFTLVGQDATLTYNPATGAYTLTAEYGTFTLTGQDAALLASRLLTAGQGAFALSGQDVGLLAGRVLTAANGSYTLTGFGVALLASRLLTSTYGTFVLTGQAVSFLITGPYTPFIEYTPGSLADYSAGALAAFAAGDMAFYAVGALGGGGVAFLQDISGEWLQDVGEAGLEDITSRAGGTTKSAGALRSYTVTV